MHEWKGGTGLGLTQQCRVLKPLQLHLPVQGPLRNPQVPPLLGEGHDHVLKITGPWDWDTSVQPDLGHLLSILALSRFRGGGRTGRIP